MIDMNEIFSDSDSRLALLCNDAVDTNDLANMAENIVTGGIGLVSLSPNMVPDMWVYLEKRPVKILSRFDFVSNHKNMDDDIANLAKGIIDVSKHGADGVQIFVKMHNLSDFVEKILPVRADLFFQKDLCMCLDISDIDINNWNLVFQKLRQIGAKALGLTLNEDMGNRSDFVGRVYGMLKNWDMDGELHFMLNNNYDRIDQVVRLIESEKPELNDRVKFFLEY